MSRRQIAVAFGTGFLFAIGLALSGMTQPAKVIGFLDLAGDWDPSLAFVMGGGIAVYAPFYRLTLRRPMPLFARRFLIPTRRELDPRLIIGGALFGVGWGLGGFCPGPGITSLGAGSAQAAVFVAGMLAGMLAHRKVVGALDHRRAARSGGA